MDWENVRAIDGSIASGTTFGTICTTFGAAVVSINIATAATGHAYTIQVSNTTTTTTFLPLYGNTGTGTISGPVALATQVGGLVLSLGTLATGCKYMRVASDIALVNGQTITVYNIR
jgi:hypothetical protein